LLRILTFGGCRIERDGVRLDELSGQRKGLALLALLAAAGDRGLTRETVVGFIWPDSDDERARISLKQLIHSLRSQLHAPELLLPSADLRLNPDVITSDVSDFRAAIAARDLESAAALHVGAFLDGFYLKGADEFERWVATERAAFAASATRAMEALATRSAERGETRAAVDWWRRVANADPLGARAATGLMLALEAAGERAGALQHARVYEQLVDAELGTKPDASVLEVIERLRSSPSRQARAGDAAASRSPAPAALEIAESSEVGSSPVSPLGGGRTPRRRTWLVAVTLAAGVAAFGLWMRSSRVTAAAGAAPTPASSRAWAGGPSIAVLPFANTSGDTTNEAFSDGLTDELIATLSAIDGLRVAGRTSSFALKGKRLGVRAVADTLGVASVLEGSVRREGRRLKVAAQLVNTSDGAVLWTQTYDRQLVDVFAVQEEIARAIGDVLRPKLLRDGSDRIRRPTEDPEAHDLYLRGRYLLTFRQSREGALRAAQYFTQAAARDSNYASAYAGLSDVHTRLAVFGYGRPIDEFARARAFALRALALDSTSAEAHASLAHVLCVHDYDWAGAEREFRRAIVLGRASTIARVQLAVCLASQGRFDEGLAQLDTARGIDPLSPLVPNMRGRLLNLNGQPDLAIRSLNDALELSPQLDLAYQMLGHAHLQKGMYPEAIAALRRSASMSGARDSAQLAYAYAVAGQRAEARRVVALLTQPPGRYVPPYHLAMAYSALGDVDEAFRLLERAYAERASFMNGVKVERAFQPLHADPRWGRLLGRMGLAP
jgi:TolB-like protein/DNA-binding SARP family transcriptional activator/tetratricopeptide (TPR) repeat protein